MTGRWAGALLIASLAWLAHSSRARELGLYEDDHVFIATAFDPGWPECGRLELLARSLRAWPQGRPLEVPLLTDLAWVGARLGGLPGCYALAAGLVAANALLVAALARRVAPAPVALLAGVAFALYPADASVTMLTHAFILQPALLLALLALLASSAGGRRAWLVAPLAALSIMTYEAFVPLLLAAPLLRPAGERRRALLLHAALVAGLFAGSIGLRTWLGDARLGHLGGPAGAAVAIARGAGVGPAVGLGSYAWAPAKLVQAPSLDALLVGAAVAALLAPLLARVAVPARVRLGPLALAGAGLLVAGYLLAGYHRAPVATLGRDTRVHLAGGVGAALLVAAAWAAALRTPPGPRGRLVRGLLALHAGLLVAHHRQAQADYARAWTAQRAFWPQVAALVPDLDEGLLVFAEGPPEPPAQALAHGWSDAMVLERLWRLPAAWRTPPRLFYVAPGWQGAVRREGGVAVWTVPAATVAAHPEPLPPGKVVLLVEQAPGRWSRRAGELWTPAGPVQLRPPGPPVRLEPGPLAPFLLD